MKRLVYFSAILLLVATVFSSCSKAMLQSKSCENNDFTMLETSILGKQFMLRDYKGEDGAHFIYSPQQNVQELQHLFEILKEKGVDADFSKVGGFVAYTDKPVGTEHLELGLDDMKALTFYINAGDSINMLFKTYVLKNGEYNINDSFKKTTTRISSNHAHDVAEKLFDTPVTKISFYDFSNVPKRKKKLLSRLYSTINQIYSRLIS